MALEPWPDGLRRIRPARIIRTDRQPSPEPTTLREVYVPLAVEIDRGFGGRS